MNVAYRTGGGNIPCVSLPSPSPAPSGPDVYDDMRELRVSNFHLYHTGLSNTRHLLEKIYIVKSHL